MDYDILSKKPIKSSDLKIIDHVGILYGTVNGEKLWEVDKVAWEILKMCEGNKTVDQIIWSISKKFELDMDDVKPIVTAVMKELKRINFIRFKN
ncbi:MAG: PqqD family peptide modification chaperone [Candidatus Aenigmarchaeota archaeon]|nr:PqqD family peptide modification chaperone [Candidatus Aenigmarchaeota archaeon]